MFNIIFAISVVEAKTCNLKENTILPFELVCFHNSCGPVHAQP